MKKTRRKVLITGGTGSIGRALVEAFSNFGYSVTFQYKSQTHVARRIAKKFQCQSIQADFLKPLSLSEQFDILVNNAGINVSSRLTDRCSDDELMATLDVNLVAPFRLIRALLPHMMGRGWGRIINVSSIYGLRGVEGNCPYTISKHALSGLTKTVAKEYAPFGITCNEICPGPTEGELMRRIADRAYIAKHSSPKEYLDSVAAEIPARRMAKPTDIASLALFLASDESCYVNGASIPSDGALIA